MPLMSGPQLVRALREEHPELRILLISGFTGDEVLPAEGLGGVRFLAKPFDLDTFLRTVREVTEG